MQCSSGAVRFNEEGLVEWDTEHARRKQGSNSKYVD